MLRVPSDWLYGYDRTYTQVFALTFLYNIGIIAAGVVLLFVICLIVKLCLGRKKSNEQLRESIITEEYSRISVADETEKKQLAQSIVPQTRSKPLVFFSFLTSFFFHLFWIVASLVYLNFYMFGTFGRSVAVDVLSVFAVFMTVAIPALIWKHNTKATLWGEMRR
jgi:Na+/melibiose symporter-like transporter